MMMCMIKIRIYLCKYSQSEGTEKAAVADPMQGQLEPGLFTRSKNFKTLFFRDISNSFQSVTQNGLKPHQNFFFEKILKTDAASPIFRFF